VRTVIIGETNAGKSSLLNRLLGWERAIVSHLPGTTRDYLEEPRIVGGHCIRFVDTAGLNPSPSSIEEIGIARGINLAAGADLVLLVVDASLPFPAVDPRLASALDESSTILVWNKVDIATPREAPEPFRELRSVVVSALTGLGVVRLEAEITDFVERHRKDPGPEMIAINARHAHDLGECRAALDRALVRIGTGESDEFLAADLRCALDCLGRIGGKIDNERMLDKLFAEFCIGK
jgi:tRNA modification GTPase